MVEQTDAQKVAASLRQMADFLDAHPDLEGVGYSFLDVNVFPRSREGVAAWARAAMRSKGTVKKHQYGEWAGVDIDFGDDASIAVRIGRDEICERVVVATREETKEVPDPELLAEVPLVTVTEVVEEVEWRCHPVLANELAAAS